MAILSDITGRPLAPHQVEVLRQLVDRYLSPLDDTFTRAAMWSAIADHYLRTMAQLKVPLEQYLRDHPLPMSFDEIVYRYGTTAQHKKEIEYAKDNAAILVRGWRDDTRSDLVRGVNAAVLILVLVHLEWYQILCALLEVRRPEDLCVDRLCAGLKPAAITVEHLAATSRVETLAAGVEATKAWVVR